MKNYAHLHTPHLIGEKNVVYVAKGSVEIVVSFAWDDIAKDYVYTGIIEGHELVTAETATEWFNEASKLPVFHV